MKAYMLAAVMGKAKTFTITDPITTVEAAAILGLDPSAIRHRILKETIQAEKRGRDWYVSRQTVLTEKKQRSNQNGSKA